MFEEPELPDFDSMSQEELIEWLEALAKTRGGGASEFLDDFADEAGPADLENGAGQVDEGWQAWLDDTQGTAAAPPSAADDASLGDNFSAADDETPADLPRFDANDSGPLDAAAMAWLAEISAPEVEEELPDISDYRPPEQPPEKLDDLLSQAAQEDPLEWLESLSDTRAGPRLPTPPAGAIEDERAQAIAPADFDDAYEDDETLDDLEDESLYTRRPDQPATALESILSLKDQESDENSTQSMAPLPENVKPPATAESSAAPPEPALAKVEPAPPAVDGLTAAFSRQDQPLDLEAWYISRLRQIASADGDGPAAPPSPSLEPVAAPSKPPPPGLAAAINSARGKVEANDLRAALADYETLLRTNAGLEWVVRDMRGLIARPQYQRHPSVHRVLGDALMRQGQLDAALAVYRQALSLL